MKYRVFSCFVIKFLPQQPSFFYEMWKYNGIQVWIRGTLLWWKPTWPGSNRVCSSQQRSIEVQHILIKSDYREPWRKSCWGSKYWKWQENEFWKTQASLNQQPGIKWKKWRRFGSVSALWRASAKIAAMLYLKGKNSAYQYFNLYLLHV